MCDDRDAVEEKETDISAALSVLMCCFQLRAPRRPPRTDHPRQVVQERNEWDEV